MTQDASSTTASGLRVHVAERTDVLVDALVAAETERITQAVTDGRLTQEEADERLADLEARVTERVSTERPERGERPDAAADDAASTDTSGA